MNQLRTLVQERREHLRNLVGPDDSSLQPDYYERSGPALLRCRSSAGSPLEPHANIGCFGQQGPARCEQETGAGRDIDVVPVPVEPASRRLAENAQEASAHIGFDLADGGIERGEIRDVAGTRKQAQEAGIRALGIESRGQA